MRKNIVIYGSGGMGRELLWLIERINQTCGEWEILGFVDDFKAAGDKIDNYTVLGGIDWLEKSQKEIYFACGIGDGGIRKGIFEKLAVNPQIIPATLIDPSAITGKNVIIETGVIITASCRVTIDCIIKKGTLLNTGSAVGHDCTIGEFNTLLTNTMLSGNVQTAADVQFGSGCFILQGIKIAGGVKIAPLSAVMSNIEQAGVYAGNPARRIR